MVGVECAPSARPSGELCGCPRPTASLAPRDHPDCSPFCRGTSRSHRTSHIVPISPLWTLCDPQHASLLGMGTDFDCVRPHLSNFARWVVEPCIQTRASG